MEQITARELDELMVSLADAHHDAPQGMDGELRRLMPLVSAEQRSQLLGWALYCVENSEVDVESESDQQQARLLLAFAVGVEVGQGVGRIEAS